MHKTVDDKIDQWFEDRGIVANGKTMSQAIKTLEETTELIDAINTNNLLEIVDAVGDIYVTLRGVCIVEGIDLSFCASAAYEEIKDRKGYLRADGTFVKEHDRLPEKLTSDDYEHTKEYYDTERNRAVETVNDNIYVKDEETGRNKQMSAKEYWDSLPDTVASTDIQLKQDG